MITSRRFFFHLSMSLKYRKNYKKSCIYNCFLRLCFYYCYHYNNLCNNIYSWINFKPVNAIVGPSHILPNTVADLRNSRQEPILHRLLLSHPAWDQEARGIYWRLVHADAQELRKKYCFYRLTRFGPPLCGGYLKC